jgi:hypothetical protein
MVTTFEKALSPPLASSAVTAYCRSGLPPSWNVFDVVCARDTQLALLLERE